MKLGANYKAIADVYGTVFSAIRVKGCQWHFKSDVKNHVSKLKPEDQETLYPHAMHYVM